MIILDGKNLSAKIKDEVKADASSYKKTPLLAVILVGEDEASKIYINNKRKACEYVGMSFLLIHFNDGTSEDKIVKKIKSLNKDDSVNGIIVQLPLPKQYNKDRLLNAISPEKDVDGLGNYSQARLLSGNPNFVPCTALGILEIFDYYKINLEGKNVCVLTLEETPYFLYCKLKIILPSRKGENNVQKSNLKENSSFLSLSK